MRLKQVTIIHYKNLKDFSVDFEGDQFLDIFVGKNASGKSNFLEALLIIFEELYASKKAESSETFDYTVTVLKDGKQIEFAKKGQDFFVDGKSRKSISVDLLPDNILVYYSGKNETVFDICDKYQSKFLESLKGASSDDSPVIYNIDHKYKKLLLISLAVKDQKTLASNFVLEKLGLNSFGDELRFELKRPSYASQSRRDEYNVDEVAGVRFWKAEGPVREFLDRITACYTKPEGKEESRAEGYFPTDDKYVIYADLEKVRKEFEKEPSDYFFRNLNSLRLIEMLENVSCNYSSEVGQGRLLDFSDGQFQSLYLFAITELFSDSNCLSLLDEPDSFLHPDWQFNFLQQVTEISKKGTDSNHIIMTSHSASTIAAKVQSRIRLMEFSDGEVVAVDSDKPKILKTLSSGLITLSENEANLTIRIAIDEIDGPVLFTEGKTDQKILEIAWEKLNPSMERPFGIQSAFDCNFLSNLLRRGEIYENYPDREFFALFDFDEAFNQWNSGKGELLENDVTLGLAKKLTGKPAYFLLLPVAEKSSVRKQVVSQKSGKHFSAESRFPIELVFHDVPGLEEFYIDIDDRAQSRGFCSNKRKAEFAFEIVPGIEKKYFEPLRPIFDFILSKIKT